MQLSRKKKRSYLFAVLYRIFIIGPFSGLISDEKKMRLFCYLAWVFEMLAMNASHGYYKVMDHPFRKLTHDFLLPHIDPSYTILDLGCKHGHFSYMLSQKAKEVIGVDHNLEYIALAKKNYQAPNLEFFQGDAYDYLKKNNKKYDVLILAHVLEHLDNPKEFLNRFKGFFNYIYVEVPDFNKDMLNVFRADLKTPFIFNDQDHVNEFERWQIKEIIESCSLTIEDSQYIVGIQYLWIKC